MTWGKPIVVLLGLSALAASTAVAEPVRVFGRVTDAGDRPVDGVRVELLAFAGRYAEAAAIVDGAGAPDPAALARGGPDGDFELTAPAGGMWRVRVAAPGYMAMEHDLVPLVASVVLPPVVLERPRWLTVQVGDRAGPTTTVRFVTQRPGDPPSSDATPGTRAAAGWRLVDVVAQGSVEQAARLPVAPARRPMVAAWTEGRLAGHGRAPEHGSLILSPIGVGRPWLEVVTAGGHPAAGALLFASGRALPVARAGTDGSLPRPPTAAGSRGSPAFHVLARDGQWADLGVDASSFDSRPAAPQRLVLQPARPVAGRVLDAEGRPATDAIVWPCGWPGAAVSVERDGRFALRISGDDRHPLCAAAPGHLPWRGVAREAAGPVVRLARAAVVAGRVVDPEGEAVAGVTVEAADAGDVLSTDPRPRATTGQDGRFRLADLAPGKPYRLAVAKAGYKAAEVAVDPRPSGAPEHRIEIVLNPGALAIGRVVDPDGAAIQNAEVRLVAPRVPGNGDALDRRREARTGPVAVSDADGRFALPEVSPGVYDLAVAAEGLAPAIVRGVAVPISAEPVDLGTVTLIAGIAVVGQVVDQRDQPVADATVRLHRGGRLGNRDEETAVTDPEGLFSIAGVRTGERLVLSVSKPDHGTVTLGDVVAPTREPLRIVLAEAARIDGRVVDRDGMPVAGARVAIHSRPSDTEPGRPSTRSHQVTFSGMGGGFSVADVVPGTVALEATADGYRPHRRLRLDVAPGAVVADLELILTPGAILEGTVSRTDGSPIAGAVLRLVAADATERWQARSAPDGPSVQTDAAGTYRLDGLAPGSLRIAVEHPAFRPAERTVELADGTGVAHFVLEPGLAVSGRVSTAATGEPLAGAVVELIRRGHANAPLERRAITAEDGQFLVEGLEPGRYSVTAASAGLAARALDEPLVLDDRDVHGLDIVLDAGIAVRGRVLGLDFDALAEVIVSAAGVTLRHAQVDPEGGFRIANLGPGEWLVQAEVPGQGRRVSERLTVEAGDADARIDLDFGGGFTLEGRILDAARPLAGAGIMLTGRTSDHFAFLRSDSSGHFTAHSLPADDYRIELRDARDLLRHVETLPVYADQSVEIVVRAVRLTVRVVDAVDDRPIADARLVLRPADTPGAPPHRAPRIARSDAAGTFVFEALAGGPWQLEIDRTGYRPVALHLSLGAAGDDDGVDVALAADPIDAEAPRP